MIFFLLMTTISFIGRLLLCVPFIGSCRTSRPAWTTGNSWLTRFPRLPREKWKTGTKRNKRPAGSPRKRGVRGFPGPPGKSPQLKPNRNGGNQLGNKMWLLNLFQNGRLKIFIFFSTLKLNRVQILLGIRRTLAFKKFTGLNWSICMSGHTAHFRDKNQ